MFKKPTKVEILQTNVAILQTKVEKSLTNVPFVQASWNSQKSVEFLPTKLQLSQQKRKSQTNVQFL